MLNCKPSICPATTTFWLLKARGETRYDDAAGSARHRTQLACASSITLETLSTPSRCRAWRGERRTSRQIPLSPSLPSKQAALSSPRMRLRERPGKRISNSQDSDHGKFHIRARVAWFRVLPAGAKSRNLNDQYYGIYFSTEIAKRSTRHGLFRKCSVVRISFGWQRRSVRVVRLPWKLLIPRSIRPFQDSKSLVSSAAGEAYFNSARSALNNKKRNTPR